jgi:hypothetical protein
MTGLSSRVKVRVKFFRWFLYLRAMQKIAEK